MVGGKEGLLAYESQSGEDIGYVVQTSDLSCTHTGTHESPAKGQRGLLLGLAGWGEKEPSSGIRMLPAKSKVTSLS